MPDTDPSGIKVRNELPGSQLITSIVTVSSTGGMWTYSERLTLFGAHS